MLHTKFQGHQPYGPGEEDFLRLLPYMGMAAILSYDLDHLNKLLFLFPIDAPYEIWLESAKWFQKKMFEILNPSAI